MGRRPPGDKRGRGPYARFTSGLSRYFRTVLRSNPVIVLIAWMLSPCRFISTNSLTSHVLNSLGTSSVLESVPASAPVRGGEFSTGYMGI